MTPRISIPKISTFGFSQITTPGPLSPVSKRKLRNTLPPSPPATTPQCLPPPRETFPFLWQCCSCYTIYRFSTTRRCLNCSHNYCTREIAFGSNNDSSSSGGSRNKKRRRKNKYCRSEFDYEGWTAWGAWRRGHALGIESTHPEDADSEQRAREAKFVAKRHNCFTDCDFPSQCFHTQIRVLEDKKREAEREEKDDEELTEEDDEILRAYAMSSNIIHAEDDYAADEGDDDYLELNLARDLPADEGDEGEQSPTSPSNRSPFFYDEKRHNSSQSSSSSDATPGYSVSIPGLGFPPSSPAVDATKLTIDELFALIDQDDDMMPLEDSKVGMVRRRAGADSRLSVRPRNLSETVSWADLPDDLSDLPDDLSDLSDDLSGESRCDPSAGDDKLYRPNSNGSNSSSSSAEWEDVDDGEDEIMTEDEKQEDGAALRLFKRVRYAFTIEAEP